MKTKEPLQSWELSRLVDSLEFTIPPKSGECLALRRLPETVKVIDVEEKETVAAGTAFCLYSRKMCHNEKILNKSYQ